MASSFKWDDRKLRQTVNARIRNNMEKAVLMVENDAKRFVAVDTGRLRSSITHEITESKNEIKGVVGTNVNYAIAQEYGTSKQSGQAYLRPALAKNLSKIKQMLKGR